VGQGSIRIGHQPANLAVAPRTLGERRMRQVEMTQGDPEFNLPASRAAGLVEPLFARYSSSKIDSSSMFLRATTRESVRTHRIDRFSPSAGCLLPHLRADFVTEMLPFITLKCTIKNIVACSLNRP
jgi:hypothetical protein